MGLENVDKILLRFIYDCKEWSHNYYQPLVTKYTSDISNGSIKSSRRLAHLRRCFPTTNYRSDSSDFSKIQSCRIPQTSL